MGREPAELHPERSVGTVEEHRVKLGEPPAQFADAGILPVEGRPVPRQHEIPLQFGGMGQALELVDVPLEVHVAPLQPVVAADPARRRHQVAARQDPPAVDFEQVPRGAEGVAGKRHHLEADPLPLDGLVVARNPGAAHVLQGRVPRTVGGVVVIDVVGGPLQVGLLQVAPFGGGNEDIGSLPLPVGDAGTLVAVKMGEQDPVDRSHVPGPQVGPAIDQQRPAARPDAVDAASVLHPEQIFTELIHVDLLGGREGGLSCPPSDRG